jgi:RNA polymerase sigma-70 factor (ECF subfamily)
METVEDQRDLYQEIIYQLWRSYDSFSQESKFATWMYRVALNTAITYYRKESRRKKGSVDIPEHIIAEEDTVATKDIQMSHFYKAIQQLGKLEKALIFYFLENYTYKEISINLGISEGNARVKLNRAKTKLKELIKQQGYEF